MNGGGGHAPPPNGGEFLLQLLRKQSNSDPSTPSQPQTFSHDPAVAAVGPSISTFLPPHAILQSNSRDVPFHLWNHSSPPPFAPHNYFQQQNPTVNPNLNPEFSSSPQGFNYASHQANHQSFRTLIDDGVRKFGFLAENSNSKPSLVHDQDQMQKHIPGSLSRDVTQNNGINVSCGSSGQRINPGNSGMDTRLNDQQMNSAGFDAKVRGRSNNRGKQVQNGNHGAIAPPPGFASKMNGGGERGTEQRRRTNDHAVCNSMSKSHDLEKNDRILNQNGSAGQLSGSSVHSVAVLDINMSKLELRDDDIDSSQKSRNCGNNKINGDEGKSDLDDLEDHLVVSLGLEDESGDKNDKKKHHRDKDSRSDMRGQWIMGQRMRNQKSFTSCPNGINRLNAQFLALFESLIPDDEEKLKQKHLLMSLEKLVTTEWPNARLYLYGSCANSFGFPKSDIDVCLVLELGDIEKADVLLRLADILISDNLENVQALIRARVPIVKLMDPATQIKCDICINNVLAVVNTKMLRDYAQIDVRLRQLAFIVKHWAKSRGVNETYHGTLSSYAYVLMCIHFLQQRRPAILPCLQAMSTTYSATVDNIECAYFDQVEKLRNFGSRNGESIAQLVWGFFHYWAYCHDYANDVISIRRGRTISKRDKDWTRRVGNDRHLICIEDPFEVSHDLGRVVDKFSIRVIREEFERAAHIMQHDLNPCVTLFQPYVPE